MELACITGALCAKRGERGIFAPCARRGEQKPRSQSSLLHVPRERERETERQRERERERERDGGVGEVGENPGNEE